MNMKKENRKSKFGILLELLLVSLKTGLFSFGGGYAMIALLRNEFVEKRNWRLLQKALLTLNLT